MHTGLTDPHSISVNKASGRTQYAGGLAPGSYHTHSVHCQHTHRTPVASSLPQCLQLHFYTHPTPTVTKADS